MIDIEKEMKGIECFAIGAALLTASITVLTLLGKSAEGPAEKAIAVIFYFLAGLPLVVTSAKAFSLSIVCFIPEAEESSARTAIWSYLLILQILWCVTIIFTDLIEKAVG